MKLTINDHDYDVDLEPLRGRIMTGLSSLVQGASDNPTHTTLRMIVKQACNLALPTLGIVKQDRNDDPIQLVAAKIADVILTHVEASGLRVEGKLLTPFEPDRTEKEALADADSSDGGGPMGDHGGVGQREDVAL